MARSSLQGEERSPRGAALPTSRWHQLTSRCFPCPTPTTPDRCANHRHATVCRPKPGWRTRRSAPTGACGAAARRPRPGPSPCWCPPAAARAALGAPPRSSIASCRRWGPADARCAACARVHAWGLRQPAFACVGAGVRTLPRCWDVGGGVLVLPPHPPACPHLCAPRLAWRPRWRCGKLWSLASLQQPRATHRLAGPRRPAPRPRWPCGTPTRRRPLTFRTPATRLRFPGRRRALAGRVERAAGGLRARGVGGRRLRRLGAHARCRRVGQVPGEGHTEGWVLRGVGGRRLRRLDAHAGLRCMSGRLAPALVAGAMPPGLPPRRASGCCAATHQPPQPPNLAARRLPDLGAHAGAVPDDCTERALALAFGSHPALAAEVVAEARQIRQQRLRAGGDGPAQQPGQEAEQQWAQEQLGSGGGGGSGGAGAEAGEAAGAQAAAAPLRLPYRLLRHRQPTLPVDRPPHSSRLSLALPWAPPLGRTGGGANVAGLVAGGAASGSGGGTAAEEAEEAEEARLQLRQLLTLDLHGSSRAAARMVLLRRLEALVLAAPELEAEVARLRRAAAHPQARLQQGSTKSGGDGGSGGGSLSFAGDAEPGEQQQQQQQQQQQREQRRLEEYPGEPPPLKVITGVGRHSRGDRGGVLRAAVRELLAQQGLPAQDDPAGNEGGWVLTALLLLPWRQQTRAGGTALQGRCCLGPRPCSEPLAALAHAAHTARRRGAGALEPARQHAGSPAAAAPSWPAGVVLAPWPLPPANPVLPAAPSWPAGVVLVPWPALRAYLEQQRRDMEKDHFLSAGEARRACFACADPAVHQPARQGPAYACCRCCQPPPAHRLGLHAPHCFSAPSPRTPTSSHALPVLILSTHPPPTPHLQPACATCTCCREWRAWLPPPTCCPAWRPGWPDRGAARQRRQRATLLPASSQQPDRQSCVVAAAAARRSLSCIAVVPMFTLCRSTLEEPGAGPGGATAIAAPQGEEGAAEQSAAIVA